MEFQIESRCFICALFSPSSSSLLSDDTLMCALLGPTRRSLLWLEVDVL